jgi:hypothetical protein
MCRLAICLLLIVISLPTYALRCGNDLVQKGDHVLEVLKSCGEPAYEEQWLEDKIIAERAHRLLPYQHVVRSVSVREWTYNFGRRKFMRMIRFENGVVTRIETLNYGF